MGTQGQVGVVLAGCGFRDGAEVQEAVLALYFLERQESELAELVSSGLHAAVQFGGSSPAGRRHGRRTVLPPRVGRWSTSGRSAGDLR